MFKEKHPFIVQCVVVLALAARPTTLPAKSFTLSDEQLLNLDWDGMGGLPSKIAAKVIARRDVAGPGVEFDIYFSPHSNLKKDAVYCVSSIYGGTGRVTGLTIADYDEFTLKIGLVKINDSNAVEDWGPLVVGSLINTRNSRFSYQPKVIGIGREMPKTEISSTRVTETNTIESIGFTASLHIAHNVSINANNPQGIKFTLLIEPVPEAEVLSFGSDSPSRAVDINKKVLVVPDDYPRIQAAIDAAEKGTTIHIKPGDYKETLSLKSAVSLKGLDPNGVVVNCDIIEGPVLAAEDCNASEISNLTLMHTGLKRMPADFEGRFPILLLASSQVRVTQCKVKNSGSNGILVDGGNIVVRECSIYDNKRDGILVYGGARIMLEANSFLRNGGNGIHIIVCASGTVSGNTCNENAYNGISAENDRTILKLSENTCADNKGSGIIAGFGAKGSAKSNVCRGNGTNGIAVVGGGTNVGLESNTAIGNKRHGILFADRATGSATANKCIENLWHGISIADDWSTPKVDQNSCLKNKGCGLYLGQSYRASIGENDLQDNGEISYGEVFHLLWENKLAELDSIASRLRAERRRFRNGNWQLSAFYTAAGEGWPGRRKAFPEIEKQLEEWITQQPGSITPRIVLAHAYKAFAWEERGGGYAYKVSEKGWEIFRESLQKALKVLVEAEKLDVPDPDMYVTWLEVGRGLEMSDEEMDALFQKGIAIERNYWPLYTARAFAITPIWGGEPGQFEEFARYAVELTRPQEAKTLYAKIAHIMIGRYDPLKYKELGFSYMLLQQAHGDLIRLYPEADDNYLLNASCFLACVFDDREKAVALFARIGQDWNKGVWRTEEILNRYRDWASGKTKDVLIPGNAVLE